MQQFTMLIDGQKVSSEKTFKVINPALGKPFAECALGSPADVDLAVKAARKAFPQWSQSSEESRIEKMLAIAALLEQNMPEMMQLITQENGKPLNGFNGIGSGMEVGGSIAWTQATTSFSLPSKIIQDNDEAKIEVHRKPLGVVASITPWNWPLLIAIWHIMPALRTGNTVIVKPSPYTPLATIRFVELANTILPPGVLNVITGNADVGNAISSHPDINKIVFTGSTATGKQIMSLASTNLKRLTLELGGNDAGIVLPDVDVEKIANELFLSCFHNNGQTCACLKRLYVHESIYADVCAALVKIAKEVVVGNGLDEGVEIGPLQNKAQLDKVIELTNDALANGGTLLVGGQVREGDGYFFPPTIIADISDGTRLVDEEQFGPVLPVIKYSNVDDVIAIANKNECGLGGSIWSSDIALATTLASKLETGSVWINEHGAVQPDAPFGGVKQSGIGVEFGLLGLEEYTSVQTIKTSRR
ncbi:aldehyde dehydrogenase family protein [Paraglaciecola arctica]|uniref:Aldehyde dehydrogenase family 1 member A3 n=1 Tax=Paraglaciecola arctica BSs20135 TaxID=493475 RepID=K6Y432_9ALTE|nr:aldehyde dehydrogenase family protein [Paraglaciecola arctica]GAC18716.1 aldehyde dehydrogenase family 1 member A3 [Paraglaciecola arctica BSs20135]